MKIPFVIIRISALCFLFMLASLSRLQAEDEPKIAKYTLDELTDAEFWKWGWCPDGSVGQSSFQVVSEPVFVGKSSFAVTYQFDHKKDEKIIDFIQVAPKKKTELLGRPTKLSLWVYGNGSSVIFSLGIIDKDKEVFACGTQISWKGWKKCEYAVPQDFNFVGNVQDKVNGKIDPPVFLDYIHLGDLPHLGLIIREPGTIYFNDFVVTSVIED